jgi:hypothetical protein
MKKTINNILKLNLMNYQQTAENFAKEYGIELNILSVKYGKHFRNDKQQRYIFKVQLKRNGKQYTFKYGQSIFCGSNEPIMYDILTCLTKYDPIDITNFCAEYGYKSLDTIEINEIKIMFSRVQNEYENVNRLFSDIINELREFN